MRSMSLILLSPLAAACTSVAPAMPASPTEACSAATLGQFTGQPQSEALGMRMLRMTDKTALRWVWPGMAVTMDFRGDRLTVYLDAANKVERVSCS